MIIGVLIARDVYCVGDYGIANAAVGKVCCASIFEVCFASRFWRDFENISI